MVDDSMNIVECEECKNIIEQWLLYTNKFTDLNLDTFYVQ